MMRKLRLSAAVSLDGFIAGPKGEIQWIVIDPEIDFVEYMAQFDVALMGRGSFEETCRQREGGGAPGMETFVISRTLRQEDWKSVRVSDDLRGVVAELKEREGKDIWLFGGAELFRSCLDAGLVDEVELAVIPVLLGSGLKLAPGLKEMARLKLVAKKVYETTGTLMLRYEVRK